MNLNKRYQPRNNLSLLYILDYNLDIRIDVEIFGNLQIHLKLHRTYITQLTILIHILIGKDNIHKTGNKAVYDVIAASEHTIKYRAHSQFILNIRRDTCIQVDESYI